jgi:hypothetical protein
MSDVKVELTVRCYNLNIRALEGTIHHFFEKVNVNFEVFDREGNKHYPREWFIAPLTVIQEAIQLIVNGEIEKYKYDDKTQMLVML